MKAPPDFEGQAFCVRCGAKRLGAFCWRCGAAAEEIGASPREKPTQKQPDVTQPPRRAAIEGASRPDTEPLVMTLAAVVATVASLAFPWLALVSAIGAFVALARAPRERLPNDALGTEPKSA